VVLRARHRHDEVTLTPNLQYGITDDLFAEIAILPLKLGEGPDQGNGDLGLTVFNRFIRECGYVPSVAAWAEMRIPTGDGSSGVDGTLHFNVTKTLCPKFRAHLEGFLETANGRTGRDDTNRRPFQWGVGPGFDYLFTPSTLGVLNYLHRSSEEVGHPNQNILELGLAHNLTEHQTVKFALDIGLDGREETDNLGTKVEWSYSW
jgi:hypothetical protein